MDLFFIVSAIGAALGVLIALAIKGVLAAQIVVGLVALVVVGFLVTVFVQEYRAARKHGRSRTGSVSQVIFENRW